MEATITCNIEALAARDCFESSSKLPSNVLIGEVLNQLHLDLQLESIFSFCCADLWMQSLQEQLGFTFGIGIRAEENEIFLHYHDIALFRDAEIDLELVKEASLTNQQLKQMAANVLDCFWKVKKKQKQAGEAFLKSFAMEILGISQSEAVSGEFKKSLQWDSQVPEAAEASNEESETSPKLNVRVVQPGEVINLDFDFFQMLHRAGVSQHWKGNIMIENLAENEQTIKSYMRDSASEA